MPGEDCQGESQKVEMVLGCHIGGKCVDGNPRAAEGRFDIYGKRCTKPHSVHKIIQ